MMHPSFEKVGEEGRVAGHRSQSRRILMLAPPSFLETGEGPVHVLEWHSNTIKLVSVRNTITAAWLRGSRTRSTSAVPHQEFGRRQAEEGDREECNGPHEVRMADRLSITFRPSHQSVNE